MDKVIKLLNSKSVSKRIKNIFINTIDGINDVSLDQELKSMEVYFYEVVQEDKSIIRKNID